MNVVRQSGEPLVSQFDRVRPRGVGMRVIDLDHDIVLTDHVEHPETGHVIDKATIEVLPVVPVDVNVEDIYPPIHDVGAFGIPLVLLSPGHPVPLSVEHLICPLEEPRYPTDRAL